MYHANIELIRLQQLEHQKRYKMMYDEIRRVTGRGRKSSDTGCLQNARGEILMDTEDILKRWKEYIEELFADTRGLLQPFYSTGDEGTHRNFTEDEVRDAIQKSARGKAPGPDDLQVEMIQASGDGGVTAVTKLINAIYQEGKVPEGMCKSVFIALPKKAGTTRCDEHRIISLMSQLTKILVRLLITRIKGRTMHDVAEQQYGFIPDRGTRNAIFILRRIAERAIEKQKDVYVCFIDYSKAFDKVKHDTLFRTLDALDVDEADKRVLADLDWRQSVAVKHNEIGEWQEMKRGVRQGCVGSPHLFNLYTEPIMRQLDDEDGFPIGGRHLNNLRYADDTVILADSQRTAGANEHSHTRKRGNGSYH